MLLSSFLAAINKLKVDENIASCNITETVQHIRLVFLIHYYDWQDTIADNHSTWNDIYYNSITEISVSRHLTTIFTFLWKTCNVQRLITKRTRVLSCISRIILTDKPQWLVQIASRMTYTILFPAYLWFYSLMRYVKLKNM